jgi:hypothetical protein
VAVNSSSAQTGELAVDVYSVPVMGIEGEEVQAKGMHNIFNKIIT